MAAVAISAASPLSAAYLDARPTTDEVHMDVDSAGQARIEHRIRYEVISGMLHGFDWKGVSDDVGIDGDVIIESESDPQATARAERDDKGVHIRVDGTKGLKRGTYVFVVRCSMDLVGTKALRRDGSLWRLDWTAPAMDHGLEDYKVILRVPPGPTAPRWASDDGVEGEDGISFALRRSSEEDEVQLSRIRVARGEPSHWSVRLDPKAFPAIQSPDLRHPLPEATTSPPEADLRVLGGLLALGAAFALLVVAKVQRAAAFATAGKPGPTPVVPLALPFRAVLSALALSLGIALQRDGSPIFGACVLGVAMALSVHRAAQGTAAPRGPGRWLPLRAPDAFGRQSSPGGWLDAGTGGGKIALAVFFAVVFAVAGVLLDQDPRTAVLLVLDSFVVLPLFLTGGQAQTVPTSERTKRLFEAIFLRLIRSKGLRVTPLARFPVGLATSDEVRLLLTPRRAVAGFVGLEVGVGWLKTPGGFVALPEVLVRVLDGSVAADRAAVLAGGRRSVPGRRLDERVFVLTPPWPTVRATAKLAEHVAYILQIDEGTSPPPKEQTSPPRVRWSTLRAWVGARRPVALA